MANIFSELLFMSLSGSILILAVMLMRLPLKKAPRQILCLLWLLAVLRLIVPFRIESSLSLQPALPTAVNQQSSPLSPSPATPAVPNTGALPGDVEITVSDNAVTPEQPAVTDYTAIAVCIWLTGTATLWIYSLTTWIRLKRQVRNAVIHSEGIWISGKVDTAFVLGLFRPRIYLPARIDAGDLPHILAHEHSHIARGDPWWKLLGFAALTVHWFNPLVWAAYILLCRDIEMACDERVVKHMDKARRKEYSAALLTCSADHRHIAACPVAFSEISVKARIKNVLHYKKPSFWILLISGAILVAAAVFLLTTPASVQPLELCRAALEAHQARSASKITVTTTYSGDNIPAEPIEHTYWRDGDNYLVKLYIDDGLHRPGWLLKTGEETYCQGIAPYYPEGATDYTDWVASDKIPGADFTDWLDEYRWNTDEITLVETHQESGNTLVTFTVAEALTDTIGGTADHRTVTFCLNGNGVLVYAQREVTYSGTYEGEAYRATSTVRSYVAYDESEIRGMILGRIGEVPSPQSED